MTRFGRERGKQFSNILWVLMAFREGNELPEPAFVREKLHGYGEAADVQEIATVRKWILMVAKNPGTISRITEQEPIKAQIERTAKRFREKKPVRPPHPKNELLQRIFADLQGREKQPKNKPGNGPHPNVIRGAEGILNAIKLLRQDPGNTAPAVRNHITALRAISTNSGRESAAAGRVKEALSQGEITEIRRLLERRERVIGRRLAADRERKRGFWKREKELLKHQTEERSRSERPAFHSYRPGRRKRR
jgi:hypothetical protein